MAMLVALVALVGAAGELRAQNLVSVPLPNGFIGTRASSAGSAESVKTFATLGIARLFFIQSSSTNQFELQGNDIPGTLRIVRTNGTTLDIPASANWRMNTGSTTDLIGILPRPASPITFAYSGGSIQITNGDSPGGTSIGGYVAGYTGTLATDGSNQSGNAAQSQLLNGLNAYLATVVSSRPAGPVTVTAQTTTSTTPTIAGTATVAAGEALSVVLDGVQYTTTSTPAVVRSGTSWSLALTTPLALGTYSVTATITDADGFTLSDATSAELVIASASSTVTIGGSFTASDRAYDGTTVATGTTGALTLAGVNGGHQVTIASATFAFQSAAVGTGRTVTITNVTLGGTNAASYTVNLAGAPTAAAAITARPVTIGGMFTAASRAFDGTTAATIATNALTVLGAVGGDALSLTGVTAAFANAAVGTAKPVAITAATLAGAAASNYALNVAGAPTTTADITSGVIVVVPPIVPPVVPATGTVTIAGGITAHDRVYDGTTAATGNTSGLSLVGVGPCQQVTIASVTLGFQSAGAGTGRTVVITNVTLGGADAGAYTVDLTGAPTTTASITARPVTIGGTFTAASKPFDGNATATIAGSALTLVGVVGGDAVTLAGVTAAFGDPLTGNGKPVSITGATLAGAAAGNYTLSLAGAPTSTASITSRLLTIGGSFAVADKVHDGTTDATITRNDLRLVGAQPGDEVALTWANAAFADAAVGAGKRVTLRAVGLTGAAASTYTLVMTGAPTTTASIVAAAPPSAPRNVAAAPGAGSLAITWSAPETVGCRAITGYVVEGSMDGGRSWTQLAATGAAPTAATVQGLTNNRAYLVRVAAVNPCGTSAFTSAAGPFVPVAPMPTPTTPLATIAEVVQDTIVRVRDGGFTLRLRAADESGAALPVDSSRTLQLEHGGRATADGSGFAPSTWVTLYLIGRGTAPSLLGTVPVATDGTFAAAVPVAATLPEGAYTLQVNGIDPASAPRSVALAVEVVPPPPDLDLTATPDRATPAVGDTITITLTVTNHGRGPAIDVVIPRAFTEPGFTVVRTTPVEGTYRAPTQEWSIARIEPGAHARLLLTAVVVPPTAPAAPRTAP
ncbi:hypothetical protein rosag_34310 [Roseisolibacter agri]|uniref:Fibronectin type-III domain-containing protein n=2 Tax=Roseisolibacter agri TaxID=2014610 RepID=A0AA37QJF0_9BACT|nr:hypothetical protein rosag_34310 [Roseisolibacter agri]